MYKQTITRTVKLQRIPPARLAQIIIYPELSPMTLFQPGINFLHASDHTATVKTFISIGLSIKGELSLQDDLVKLSPLI